MFGRVDVTEERVLIVASGPSLDRCGILPIPPRTRVIAVNHAIERVPADYWVTVNPERTEDLMAAPFSGTRYLCAAPERHAPLHPHVTYLRRAWPAEGLSEDPGTLHSGNSAFAALGLAYLMGARRIALLGVDGGNSIGHHVDRWGRWKSLEHLPELFISALPQLEARGILVANGSPESRVTCFPRVTPTEAIAWLHR